MTYGSHFKNTPQSQPIPGKVMVQNPAGGFVYEIDDWTRLRRFLILGAEGGSYYESERKLTLQNAETLRRCLNVDYKRAVDLIVEVSDRGLAPKNDPAVFALACATKYGPTPEARKYAFKALPKVCRIGTHLFQFAQAREDIGAGWGRGMRQAVASWYVDRPAESLITQALKYQQRNGVAHRDLMRLAHPQAESDVRKAIFSAIVRGEGGPETAPTPGAKADSVKPVRSVGRGWKDLTNFPLVDGYLQVQTAQNASDAAKIVSKYSLPRELVPTQFLKDPNIWAALLPHMGIGALTRNLGNLSKCGLLAPLSETAKLVSDRFSNEDDIKKSRLHPFAILVAARTYASGHGVRGGGAWTVVPQVVTALDSAFDLAFYNVEPTGKRFLLAVDVSSSMTAKMNGIMSAAECAAAMALITARTEPSHYIMGFADQFRDLKVNAKDTLPTVLHKVQVNNFGGTDTTIAVQWAIDKKIPVDVFEVLSDGATWAGDKHTSEALKEYRKKMNVRSKLAVVNFVAHGTSIADPEDPGSVNFVGMDASLPQALAAFVTE